MLVPSSLGESSTADSERQPLSGATTAPEPTLAHPGAHSQAEIVGKLDRNSPRCFAPLSQTGRLPGPAPLKASTFSQAPQVPQTSSSKGCNVGAGRRTWVQGPRLAPTEVFALRCPTQGTLGSVWGLSFLHDPWPHGGGRAEQQRTGHCLSSEVHPGCPKGPAARRGATGPPSGPRCEDTETWSALLRC